MMFDAYDTPITLSLRMDFNEECHWIVNKTENFVTVFAPLSHETPSPRKLLCHINKIADMA